MLSTLLIGTSWGLGPEADLDGEERALVLLRDVEFEGPVGLPHPAVELPIQISLRASWECVPSTDTFLSFQNLYRGVSTSMPPRGRARRSRSSGRRPRPRPAVDRQGTCSSVVEGHLTTARPREALRVAFICTMPSLSQAFLSTFGCVANVVPAATC